MNRREVIFGLTTVIDWTIPLSANGSLNMLKPMWVWVLLRKSLGSARALQALFCRLEMYSLTALHPSKMSLFGSVWPTLPKRNLHPLMTSNSGFVLMMERSWLPIEFKVMAFPLPFTEAWSTSVTHRSSLKATKPPSGLMFPHH